MESNIKDKTSLFLDLEFEQKKFNIFFKNNHLEFPDTDEVRLILELLPSMMLQKNINLNRNISKKLFYSMSQIMDIYCAWNDKFHRIEINAPLCEAYPHTSTSRVGAFFSGGVDSFYTFLKNKDVITDLIYVHGFELGSEKPEIRDRTTTMLNRLSKEFGVNIIEIETNVREYVTSYVNFITYGHGIILASIGHLLSLYFKKIFIAGTHSYAHMHPLGTHPLLDPLWSSESLEFVHHGCEASRFQKINYISQFESSLNFIKVCWNKNRPDHNCRKCAKCLITMIDLDTVGALEKSSTLGPTLDLDQVKKEFIFLTADRIVLMNESIRAIHEKSGNDKLAKILTRALNRPQWLRYVLFFYYKHRLVYDRLKARLIKRYGKYY